MGIVGSERVFKVLDTNEKIINNGCVNVDWTKVSISFQKVNFSYTQGEKILKNLSFEINSGKMLALVGKTGAGKTSIINILNRFYEIDSGFITINGVKIQDISLHILRKISL